MNLVDVFLWVIVPYTIVAILIMSIIWQYDYRLQEDQTITGFQLKKLTIIIFNLSFLGFVISGWILIMKHGVFTIFSYLMHWSIGLATLNPNMAIIFEQPVLLVFHLLFVFILTMISFKHNKQLILYFHCLFSVILFGKETTDMTSF